MKPSIWLKTMWRRLWASSPAEMFEDEAGGRWDDGRAGAEWSGLGQSLMGRSLEMNAVQEEVAIESRGQVLIAGRCDELNRRCLARLRAAPPAPPGGPIYAEGFFTIVSLPASQAGWTAEAATAPWAAEWQELTRAADLVLYVFDAASGWLAEDGRWYGRLRATGTPLLLAAVLPGGGANDEPEGEEMQSLPLPSGERPVRLALAAVDPAAGGAGEDVMALVERMLAQRPRLAIPLAQEIPGCRKLVAMRAIRNGMLMAGLMGAQPIPLLDLPLQVSVNWKMALQLAAIFGHTGLDHRSRELLGAVAWNLSLRYVIGQAAKLIPVLGWGIGAGVSAFGAWAFGSALLGYYQRETQAATDNAEGGGVALAAWRLWLRRRWTRVHTAASRLRCRLRWRRRGSGPTSAPESDRE